MFKQELIGQCDADVMVFMKLQLPLVHFMRSGGANLVRPTSSLCYGLENLPPERFLMNVWFLTGPFV
jgi:hypothetical protein